MIDNFSGIDKEWVGDIMVFAIEGMQWWFFF